MKVSEIRAYANFYNQQRAIESRGTRRLLQMSAPNQAATLAAYNRNSQILLFPNGGTRNSRPVNNSSQALGGTLPLVTRTPDGVYVGSR